MKDIIIVGRGLAGATLSFQLLAKGIKHHIVDQPSLSSSSKVAAGLVNPIVLKRLKMVQGADEFMTHIPDFYQTKEVLTGFKFYHESTIHHIFANAGEINLWEEKKDNVFHSQFLKGLAKNTNPNLLAPHGLGVIEGIGWLDTQSFLNAHKAFCNNNSILITETPFPKNDLSTLAESGQVIILCNGHLLKDWEVLPENTFTPTRGEVMTIETDGLSENNILHSSIFAIPLGKKQFKIGATYHWDKLNDMPTGDGIERLKTDLEKIYSGKYEVINHQAGVRPNTKDRKPIIGKLKDNVMVFNGMGSRAALMAPQLSNTFLDYLTTGNPLPAAYNIDRFL
ncbi:FAD dependent oxidoreductase [Owenweeksia hongkongensis DSM 17368]|uniref:FAD dependent oxidoreductase n=1 Tax=Owenweeksia hongkongensis (strain DSM 17368 / CIP 108786 / JCM 12287 / NRRL B-23963 / UST20020801) TaxID=926562 RepID=G8R091_OWEHD|nr:FAD-dependent oxidoreductase [Owenweeksia hongkongensis]AEV33757.1 FAD dependent oxidoreductase [Owenweeksia hongkongensis DSM 17368]